jgi:hypothetical protein
MSDINKQNLKAKAVPFFARYLEGQDCEELSEQEAESIRGGDSKSIPDLPRKKLIQTMKAPSDHEDGGGGGVMTLKYPSDHEDGGGGGIATRKYPSDNEEGCGLR